jgi:23S rRNA pseudouridine1911/1915/1917 synthase
MDVLYIDNHILVVIKPAGLATQPSLDNKESLEGQAKAWIKEKYQKPGAVYLHAVHRLDKPVSGLVLFARTSKALSRLNGSMRAKKFIKKYTAVVEGNIRSTEGFLEHYLVHGDRKALVVNKDAPEAKLCRLHYKVLQRQQKTTLVEIDLDTGRYHQIRAQFAAEGHPIVGDTKYGARPSGSSAKSIALHQGEMSFPHPTTKEEMTFSCLLPWPSKDFNEL